MATPVVASLPTAALRERLGELPGITTTIWDLTGPPPAARLDLVVPPYMSWPVLLRSLSVVRVRAVQSQSIGFDGVAAVLPPGVTFCNAAGVHEASTAELAVGLIIADRRELAEMVRAQARRGWDHRRTAALTDSRVLVIGQGGVGRAIVARLAPFEVTVVRVASTGRHDADGPVHGVADLPGLLPDVDVVVLAVPLTATTTGLVDTVFLASMKPGALLVNVARGPVVDTVGLVTAVRAGHVRAALDVTDPEPLPHDHPLWTLPGVIITPHLGGNTDAMAPRVAALVRRQLEALRDGRPLRNVVLGPGTDTPARRSGASGAPADQVE